MRFTLIDQIVSLEPGQRITAIKNLSLAEEYLADHFPQFPVMPGVFMLESLTQSAAWLIRASENFAHAIVTLSEARNVKYADFVSPGQTLVVTAEILSQDDRQTKVKAQGTVNGTINVSARLVLERYNQADDQPSLAGNDRQVIRMMRELYEVLYRPGHAWQESNSPV
ncbi:MAG: 3-hydroxyacyl-ACP dehydratase FabZ family protein [Pirellulales bacterium]|nr:3-hydroxyacyl-ACP dehydratase FabZ family protein [Pirellulales bacterium]